MCALSPSPVFLRVGRDEEVRPLERQQSKLDVQQRHHSLSSNHRRLASPSGKDEEDVGGGVVGIDEPRVVVRASSAGEGTASASTSGTVTKKTEDDRTMDVLGSLKTNEEYAQHRHTHTHMQLDIHTQHEYASTDSSVCVRVCMCVCVCVCVCMMIINAVRSRCTVVTFER